MLYKQIALLVLLILSNIISATASDEESLTEDELKQLLEGKTVKGVYLEGNKPFTRFYDEDGDVRQRVGDDIEEGKWFVDEQGKRCIVWSGKKKKCKVIVKENELYNEYTIQKNGKRKLTVIYNKINVGNPSDL